MTSSSTELDPERVEEEEEVVEEVEEMAAVETLLEA